MSLLGLLLGGCTQLPTIEPTTAPPTPISTSPGPLATSTPAETLAQNAKRFGELTATYEAAVPPQDNGWPTVAPLLQGEGAGPGPSLVERIEGLDLSRKRDLAFFDERVVPVLRQGFARPHFFAPHRLLLGQDPLNPHYRSLRRLCELLGERAELAMKAGKFDEALGYLELPLALAQGMEHRPETVSIALFSLSYAEMALRPLCTWLRTDALSPAQLTRATALLRRYRPDRTHVRQTVLVDFAQLDNSLADEETRSKILGLGLSSPAEVQTWRKQASGILTLVEALGRPVFKGRPDPAATFSEGVLATAPAVQGLILEYPAMVASLRFGYAGYLATEVAVGLKLAKLKGPAAADGTATLEAQLFAGDPGAQQAAVELFEVKADVGSSGFSIIGRGKTFQAISPDGPPSFFTDS